MHNILLVHLETIMNFVVGAQWVDVNRWYAARQAVEWPWDNIFLSHFSEGCLSFHTVHIKCLSQYKMSNYRGQGVTSLSCRTLLCLKSKTLVAYPMICHKAYHGCSMGFTSHTETVMVTLSTRSHELKNSPLLCLLCVSLTFIMKGPDESMQEVLRECLLWEQHLQLSKHPKHPTCIHTYIHWESHIQSPVPYTCISRT